MKIHQPSGRLLILLTLLLTACTTVVSEGVNEDGSVSGTLHFPDDDRATQPKGSYPNRENLANVTEGMSKKQLYRLIGRPHFQEASGALEWDYIMHFKQADNQIKTCRYKVVFNKEKIAKNFFWQPEDCLNTR